jgi:hypothetical protein
MKKLLGIVVLGLFLKGCATPVGSNYNLEYEKDYVALTEMRPIVKGVVTKSRLKDIATFYSLGLYSPHYFDFYAYGDIKNEAKNDSIKACEKLRKEKKWESKATCTFRKTELTGKRERLAKEKMLREKAEQLLTYQNTKDGFKVKVISWDQQITTYGYSNENIQLAVLLALANCYSVNNNCWVFEENGKEILAKDSYNWNEQYHKIISSGEYVFTKNNDDGDNSKKVTQVFKKQAGVTYKEVGNMTYGSDGKSYRTVGNRTLGSDGSWARTIGSGSGSRTIYSDGTSSRTIGSGSGSRTIYSDGTSSRTIGSGSGSRTINSSTRTSCRVVGTRTFCSNY